MPEWLACARPHLDTVRAREEELSFVSPAVTCPTSQPTLPCLPTSTSDLVKGESTAGRQHAETAGHRRLDFCICIFAKDTRVGGALRKKPHISGLLPLPFLTLTFVPMWGGETAHGSHCRPWHPAGEPARVPSDHRQARPLEHPAQAFYTLQCNFFILFYSDYGYSGILSLR